VAGLDWPEALLIGAVLAPTDPVFAAALVGNRRVPARLRHLLNVESGVNDGLALPFVVLLLALASESRQLHLGPWPASWPWVSRSA
jgi:sodium/hydrogen antiporter